MRKLTPKQERFVAEYLIDLNATQAAIRAGYSARSAKQQGARLLTNDDVAEAVQNGRKRVSAKLEITSERLMQEIARIAFFDPRKLFTPDGEPLSITELDDDTAAAISGIDIVIERTGEGGKDYATIRKYKISDKMGALQAAMRQQGLFKDKIEHSGTVSIASLIEGSFAKVTKE